MKLLFLTGSRSDWGYVRPIIKKCSDAGVDYSVCATNMVLLPQYGNLIDEILAEGFNISDEIYMSLEGHTHTSMAKSLGVFLSSFVDVLARAKPDWLILSGDRGEQLAAAVAAGYSYTATAHIQAGERSGNIDGVARHAISKFAHLHFAANQEAAERLERMGEENFRIKVVGAPQLDELVEGHYANKAELEKRYAIKLGDVYLLVVQHPVTEEFDRAEEQISATVEAINTFDCPKIWILPNNDAGADRVRRGLLATRAGEVHVFENLSRVDYLGLLKDAAAIVGNSSSALLEAPTFGVPAVNIGRRQIDRVRGSNVIDVEFDIDQITHAIEMAMSEDFRKELAGAENPYGDGRSADRILDTLRTTSRDDALLVKRLTY